MPAAFLYLKLPTHALPADHGLEDRIDLALRDADAGSVLGWGESLGDAPPGRMRPLAFLRVDIESDALDTTRRVLQALLPTLGVPDGTELHYTRDHRALQDQLRAGVWTDALDGASPRRPADR
ncbi:hypothetical protein [Roseateles chitosanitabidus]|uniref:hypothetical protein n=1 Tax=Roseateles chitosanitabidus TaxID=65048 RepID=UPI000834FF82|nr:hypothetical protein [Roseateles chitosanitabidus]MBO9689572.1 hypothetical protein [Roseateles chitosanitabidus]